MVKATNPKTPTLKSPIRALSFYSLPPNHFLNSLYFTPLLPTTTKVMEINSIATRRRNSIATSVVVIPENLSILANTRHSLSYPHPNATSAAAKPPPLDLEFLSIKSSLAYTSLKDVLPAGSAVNSPTAGAPTPNSGYEISIRNRLVKQAAWAYLQPMSASPSYSGNHYFHRLRSQFSGVNPVSACLRFINRYIVPAVTWVSDRLMRVIGVQINR